MKNKNYLFPFFFVQDTVSPDVSCASFDAAIGAIIDANK